MNTTTFWFALMIALPASAFVDVSLQMQLGNPSNAITDTNNHSHYLIQRPIEALDYNDRRVSQIGHFGFHSRVAVMRCALG